MMALAFGEMQIGKSANQDNQSKRAGKQAVTRSPLCWIRSKP
jgi:hypothetical protein